MQANGTARSDGMVGLSPTAITFYPLLPPLRLAPSQTLRTRALARSLSQDIVRCDSYQCRLALNLILWWGAINTHPVLPALPSRRQHSSSPEVAFYSHQETHVYPLSRGIGPERSRWTRSRSQTTGGERKSRSTCPSIDTITADTVRTIDIPSTQEIKCKTGHLWLQSQG